MKLSLNWLTDWLPGLNERIPGGAGADRVAEVLTHVGFEVESIAPVARDLSGLRIAEVLSARPHPDADKLRIVRIRSGAQEEDVVCGAPNVPASGGRVCWAAPGAKLPGLVV